MSINVKWADQIADRAESLVANQYFYAIMMIIITFTNLRVKSEVACFNCSLPLDWSVDCLGSLGGWSAGWGPASHLIARILWSAATRVAYFNV